MDGWRIGRDKREGGIGGGGENDGRRRGERGEVRKEDRNKTSQVKRN